MREMKNKKIKVSFEDEVLDVKYLENAVISSEDIKEIYSYGNSESNGKMYCIMFEPLGKYQVTEEAIQYMVDNPDNKNILEKVYVINSEEAETKTKSHLLNDKPKLIPQTFKTAESGKKYLRIIIDKNRA
jgi:hypothetical protein